MKFEINEDTIIALATPPGVGAISVIRLSGPSSFTAIDKVFAGKVQISSVKTHTIHYGQIIENDEIIDDVLVSVFRAPNSYTAEDIVEISSHGSPLIAQKIISLILKNCEIRLAEPGEFTKRAFLNNRIDLAQAEAVADLINSRTSVSLRGARNQMDGLLSSKVLSLRTKLIEVSAFVELELDFAEEDIEFVNRTELVAKINYIVNEIEVLMESFSFGKVVREGINVALVGEPNVGKSSLLNYLLKESRAIVSSTPGTTRDIIREEISIDGYLFRLHDTAGIRSAKEEVEKEGVERSKELIKNADLIVFIGDVYIGFSNELYDELRKLNPSIKILKVLNKTDLGIKRLYSEDFQISAKTGDGIPHFLNGLKVEVFQDGIYSERTAIVSSVRHYDCLTKAKKNLIRALEALSENISGEFLASDLRASEISLAEIIGEVTPEEILIDIFSKFCIGK